MRDPAIAVVLSDFPNDDATNLTRSGAARGPVDELKGVVVDVGLVAGPGRSSSNRRRTENTAMGDIGETVRRIVIVPPGPPVLPWLPDLGPVPEREPTPRP